jgi:lactoylglutathione lyase
MLTGSTRLMNINHITYNVKNKDQALKWYQEVLGLKQIPKMVNGDHLYWLQLPSGAMVHIIENPNAPSQPSHHTAFEVDDIQAARQQLQGMSIECTEIQTRNDGQQAFYINDPDGNRIELCTKSGFGVLV